MMSDWIKVTDRLPTVGQRVIYFFEHVGMHLGRYDGFAPTDNGLVPTHYDAVFSSHAGFLTGDVTHWQPAPEPPPRAEW